MGRLIFRKDRVVGNYSYLVKDSVIRAEMARNGYTYTDMAKMMGVSAPTYQSFINGKIEPSASRMVKLANIFNMPVTEFFNLETEG